MNGRFQNTLPSHRVGAEWIQEEAGQPGQPRTNWTDIVKRNLKSMDITWEEAKEVAADRTEWHQRVAQCIQQNAG